MVNLIIIFIIQHGIMSFLNLKHVFLKLIKRRRQNFSKIFMPFIISRAGKNMEIRIFSWIGEDTKRTKTHFLAWFFKQKSQNFNYKKYRNSKNLKPSLDLGSDPDPQPETEYRITSNNSPWGVIFQPPSGGGELFKGGELFEGGELFFSHSDEKIF